MIPGEFDYYAPGTLAEAVALLREHGDDAKLLAGGQSLIPAMRFRLAQPMVLIDLNRVDGLAYIREDNGRLAIGAMTREAELEESSLVRSRYALLADASRVIADPIVRNRATVGGNLAHADPANDHPAVMLAYNAEVMALGPKGPRAIPIDNFFVGLFENALAHDEILTEIRIPAPGPNSGGVYLKMERKVGDYAVSAVAVQLTMSGDTCTAARIALTNVNPTPMRARNAEQALIGRAITEEVLEAAGQAAAAECDPSPDLRGSAAYKRDLTRVLTKRAIRQAVERARGGRA
ncbi:MAG: xanthine dehydrogenase family protein subunit M [Chloroflexi bacterium]|nr:xanthine dehydrogenase family protein subunit M [Chloroflexota bacterium]MCI0575916.1 xanthine dehydrogenase family protein subunit M [Chloroflexota bacterium]MCI0729038.1 xanthine dehydrogenase family protein subunit M [Chloroflexota bacterium]